MNQLFPKNPFVLEHLLMLFIDTLNFCHVYLVCAIVSLYTSDISTHSSAFPQMLVFRNTELYNGNATVRALDCMYYATCYLHKYFSL